MQRLIVPVVGTTFKDGKVSRQALLGCVYDKYWTEDRRGEVRVELRPEPTNPVDPNAVAVYIVSPEEAHGRVGFVPAHVAERIGRLIARGLVRAVSVKAMSVNRKSKVGLAIALIVGKPEMVQDSEGRTWEILG